MMGELASFVDFGQLAGFVSASCVGSVPLCASCRTKMGIKNEISSAVVYRYSFMNIKLCPLSVTSTLYKNTVPSPKSLFM
jgi:hypothetical protein